MPQTNPKVMSMVEEELRKNPKITSRELQQKAGKIDRDVGEMPLRRFNALYPLQVKRRGAPERPREAPPAAPPRRRRAEKGVDRTRIREILIQFAKDVAAAEGKADVVEVIGGVDKYVERVVGAAGAR